MATKKKSPPIKRTRQEAPWATDLCAHCGEQTIRKQREPLICGRCLGAALRLIKQEFPQQFRNAQTLFAVTTEVFRVWYPQPEEQYIH